MFFFLFFFRHEISELRRPIAVKLCHMIALWVRFITQVQKFGGLPPKKLGPKTCKIRRDFRQLSSLIANISGTVQDIQNRKAYLPRAIPPAFYKKSDELWSTNYGVLLDVSLDPPKLNIRETIFRPLGVLAPQIFTRTRD